MTYSIISTSDMHAHYPNVELDLKQLRPDLLIDNGDFLIGNLFSLFCYLNYSISPLTHLANSIQYDVMIPGNHDLDYGLDWLIQQVQVLKADYICANLYDPQGKRIFKPYMLKETRDGTRILVIGLMTSAFSRLTRPEVLSQCIVSSALESLKEVLREIVQADLKYDHLCLAYHGGIVQDPANGQFWHYPSEEDQAYQLMHQFPEIDNLICGHQHLVKEAVHSNGVAMVQVGSHGKYYGEQTFDRGRLLTNQVHKAESLMRENCLLKSIYEGAYQEWLQISVDQEDFMKYLVATYPADLVYMDLGKDKTLKGLSKQLVLPFPIQQYVIEGWRLIDCILKNEETHPMQRVSQPIDQIEEDKVYTVIATDSLLPNYRIREKILTPVIEDYVLARRDHFKRI